MNKITLVNQENTHLAKAINELIDENEKLKQRINRLERITSILERRLIGSYNMSYNIDDN